MNKNTVKSVSIKQRLQCDTGSRCYPSCGKHLADTRRCQNIHVIPTRAFSGARRGIDSQIKTELAHLEEKVANAATISLSSYKPYISSQLWEKFLNL
ncbi:unnamed protein product [Timema podura]|uniref:Uncharacterized protein n=1 Tax=Timema podura TaxID=61482 RepID=A0ABN7PF28_TIMPD|nr:unnamed protein product [Timema podura]